MLQAERAQERARRKVGGVASALRSRDPKAIARLARASRPQLPMSALSMKEAEMPPIEREMRSPRGVPTHVRYSCAC